MTRRKNKRKAAIKQSRTLRTAKQSKQGNRTSRIQSTEARVVVALRALRDGVPLSRAARENHVTVRTIRRYAGNALVQDRPGARIRAAKEDSLTRYIQIPGLFGPREVEVRGLKTVREFARYQAAVNRFLRGDRSALAEWHGKKMAGIELITAGETLKSLAHKGLLPHSFYRAFAGGAR